MTNVLSIKCFERLKYFFIRIFKKCFALKNGKNEKFYLHNLSSKGIFVIHEEIRPTFIWNINIQRNIWNMQIHSRKKDCWENISRVTYITYQCDIFFFRFIIWNILSTLKSWNRIQSFLRAVFYQEFCWLWTNVDILWITQRAQAGTLFWNLKNWPKHHLSITNSLFENKIYTSAMTSKNHQNSPW